MAEFVRFNFYKYSMVMEQGLLNQLYYPCNIFHIFFPLYLQILSKLTTSNIARFLFIQFQIFISFYFLLFDIVTFHINVHINGHKSCNSDVDYMYTETKIRENLLCPNCSSLNCMLLILLTLLCDFCLFFFCFLMLILTSINILVHDVRLLDNTQLGLCSLTQSKKSQRVTFIYNFTVMQTRFAVYCLFQ